jgi:hypothetical protein
LSEVNTSGQGIKYAPGEVDLGVTDPTVTTHPATYNELKFVGYTIPTTQAYLNCGVNYASMIDINDPCVITVTGRYIAHYLTY